MKLQQWTKKKYVKLKLQQLIQSIEEQQLKTELSPIQIGDTVRIKLDIKGKEDSKKASIKEKEHDKKKKDDKKKIQLCEGIIIAQHKAGISTTITVRRIFQNIGVERVFCIHSPLIESIEIIRRAKVRKAKLYYLRDRIGKSTRLKERFDTGKSFGIKES